MLGSDEISAGDNIDDWDRIVALGDDDPIDWAKNKMVEHTVDIGYIVDNELMNVVA